MAGLYDNEIIFNTCCWRLHVYRCNTSWQWGSSNSDFLLSAHTDRQSVDISVTVCVFFVCTVTDFSAEDKASGVKFCTAVHRRPRQGISHFGELCSQKPQIGRIGQRVNDDECSGWWFHGVTIKFARRVNVQSACVDIRQSPRTDVLVE